MNRFIKEGKMLYHICKTNETMNGICEFTTSADGVTGFKCRVCGETFSLDELIKDIKDIKR